MNINAKISFWWNIVLNLFVKKCKSKIKDSVSKIWNMKGLKRIADDLFFAFSITYSLFFIFSFNILIFIQLFHSIHLLVFLLFFLFRDGYCFKSILPICSLLLQIWSVKFIIWTHFLFLYFADLDSRLH